MSGMLRAPILVSVQWLAEKVAAKAHIAPSLGMRVLDGSWHMPQTKRDPKAEFPLKHVHGAQFFGIDDCCDKGTDLDHMVPDVATFESYVGELGINNDTHVVVYDNNDDFGMLSAQRVWWTFRYFGHSNVSVLDGGLPKWIAAGHPVTDEMVSVPKAEFKAVLHPVIKKEMTDLEKNIEGDNKDFIVLDARPVPRFQGVAPEPREGIKPGHIAGSINIPFTSMLDPHKKTMKEPATLKKVFREAGVDLDRIDKPIVATCGSGISACMLALGASLCGNNDVSIYDGSWVEWYKNAKKEHKKDVPE